MMVIESIASTLGQRSRLSTGPILVDSLNVDASLAGMMGGRPLDLGDLDVVRLLLQGQSIIDWNRVWYRDLADVNRFLSLHLIDFEDPLDRRRLRYVHQEAVSYLQEHLGLHFSADLVNPDDVRDLFLLASQTGGFRRRQIQACAILKLMHVINHMEAAELHFQVPLSEADILDLAERRIIEGADKMRDMGFPLVAFYGSRKTRNSIITKLLAKKENTAATIFDKLRFRIVTEKQDHIIPAIHWLTQNLFPFNYAIPGQSHNNLVQISEHLMSPGIQEKGGHLQGNGPIDEEQFDDNPFSGGSYRMVNFIVDFPVRVDELVKLRTGVSLGRTVFAMVEFQVLDRDTARQNEEGENAHGLYKTRQRSIVERRLKRGARWKKKPIALVD